MKARCVRFVDVKGDAQDYSDSLKLNKIYHVLEIVQDSHRRWLLRIVGETGLALFRLEQFEIVSPKIPDLWIAVWLRGSDGFALTTEVWSRRGFWDAYYDRDPIAISEFERESKKIIDADQ